MVQLDALWKTIDSSLHQTERGTLYHLLYKYCHAFDSFPASLGRAVHRINTADAAAVRYRDPHDRRRYEKYGFHYSKWIVRVQRYTI